MKNIYKEPIAKIIFNSEKTAAFPLRPGIRQECLLLQLLFNIVMEVLLDTSRKGNKISTDWEGRYKTVFVHKWHNYL